MKTINYISDFFHEELQGGGEISDKVLIDYFINNGYDVNTIKSNQFNGKIIHGKMLISNFANLSTANKNFISNNCDYIIIERDQKYVKSRNTALYDNFVAPNSEVINVDFYKKAKKVFCLSNHSKELLKSHINLENVESLGCTQFSKSQFDHLRNSYKEAKNTKWCIISGKRSNKAIQFCELNGLDYDILPRMAWKDLIKKMSEYKGLIFFSHSVETCCRLVLEARMLGLSLRTDNRVGCTYESWFGKYKGIELINFLENKVSNSMEIIKGVL